MDLTNLNHQQVTTIPHHNDLKLPKRRRTGRRRWELDDCHQGKSSKDQQRGAAMALDAGTDP